MIGLPFSAANASGRAKPTCRMLSGGLPADPLIRPSELDGFCCFAWIIPYLLSEFFERHKHAPRFYPTYSKLVFWLLWGIENQFTYSLFWSYLNYQKSISEVLSNSICLQKNPAFKPYPRKD